MRRKEENRLSNIQMKQVGVHFSDSEEHRFKWSSILKKKRNEKKK